MNAPPQALPLTLADVAAHPDNFYRTVTLPPDETLTFRPLLPDDATQLAEFLTELSPQTRAFASFASYDLTMAQELCAAIACYDKLRLVTTDAKRIIALFELSFDLTPDDTKRYQNYGIPLDPATACRFGPTIADAYQHRGLGSLLLPLVFDLARRFGQRRIILWGGVMAHNHRAIHYYQKHGFQITGEFHNNANILCYDMIGLIQETTCSINTGSGV
ncbi:MAG: GNAT family N-acetyltransferase [Anaerolineae bacterium]